MTKLNHLLPILGGFASLFISMGCEPVLLSVEVEAQEVCIGNVTVPFGPSQSVAVAQDTISNHDLGILLSDELTPKVKVLSVELTPLQGVGDLAFVDNLMVEMAPEGSSAALPPIELVQLSGADRLDSGSLYREPETAVDITTYIGEGEVAMLFELSGDIPAEPWAATMDVCMYAQASYKKPF